MRQYTYKDFQYRYIYARDDGVLIYVPMLKGKPLTDFIPATFSTGNRNGQRFLKARAIRDHFADIIIGSEAFQLKQFQLLNGIGPGITYHDLLVGDFPETYFNAEIISVSGRRRSQKFHIYTHYGFIPALEQAEKWLRDKQREQCGRAKYRRRDNNDKITGF